MKTLGELLRDKINASIEKRQQLERDFWDACYHVYGTYRPQWLSIHDWSDEQLIARTKEMGQKACMTVGQTNIWRAHVQRATFCAKLDGFEFSRLRSDYFRR
jgi:hypothetical protein